MLKRKFKFWADESTMHFWTVSCWLTFSLSISDSFLQPSTPLPQGDVGVDWIKDHPNINEIARSCQPTFRLVTLFGRSRDPDHVHFFITAEGIVEDRVPVKAGGERGYVPKIPLYVTHRRES